MWLITVTGVSQNLTEHTEEQKKYLSVKNKPTFASQTLTCTHHVWCLTPGPSRWCSQGAGKRWCRRTRLCWCHLPVTGRSSGPGRSLKSETERDEMRRWNKKHCFFPPEAAWHWWLTHSLTHSLIHSAWWVWHATKLLLWGQRCHVWACSRGEAFTLHRAHPPTYTPIHAHTHTHTHACSDRRKIQQELN